MCVLYALSAPFKSICRSLVFLSFFLNDMCFTYRIHLYLGPVHTLFTCTRIFLKPLFISFESVLCPHENNESAQPNRSCLKQLLKVFFFFSDQTDLRIRNDNWYRTSGLVQFSVSCFFLSVHVSVSTRKSLSSYLVCFVRFSLVFFVQFFILT